MDINTRDPSVSQSLRWWTPGSFSSDATTPSRISKSKHRCLIQISGGSVIHDSIRHIAATCMTNKQSYTCRHRKYHDLVVGMLPDHSPFRYLDQELADILLRQWKAGKDSDHAFTNNDMSRHMLPCSDLECSQPALSELVPIRTRRHSLLRHPSGIKSNYSARF
jgi:hypothetical protein